MSDDGFFTPDIPRGQLLDLMGNGGVGPTTGTLIESAADFLARAAETGPVANRIAAAEDLAAAGGAKGFPNWPEAAANPPTVAFQRMIVRAQDTGFHVNPVTGTGPADVPNSGEFIGVPSNAGPLVWGRWRSEQISDPAAAFAAGSALGAVANSDEYGLLREDGTLARVRHDVLVGLLALVLSGASAPALASLATSLTRKADIYATAPLVPITRPSILGQVVEGQTLTVDTGEWPFAVKFTYSWRANGQLILNYAAGPTFLVTSEEVGKTITCEVSAREIGQSRRATYTAQILQKMPSSVASVIGFGDSITVGQGASSAAAKWLNIVSAALGAGEPINKGDSGTVLQNTPDATGLPRSSNGRDRWVSALTGANQSELICIAYGFNDMRYVGNPAQFNVDNYINDMREVLSGLLASGYSRNRIVIVTPHWINDIGLRNGSLGFRGQTREAILAYVAASKQVADEFGTYWADSYTPLKAAYDAGTAVTGGDQIHPNDVGYQIIANAVLAATKRPDPKPVYALDFLAGANGQTLLQHKPEVGFAWERQTGSAPSVDAQFTNGRLFSPVPAAYHSLSQTYGRDYTAEIDLFSVDPSAAQVAVIARASPFVATYYEARLDRATGLCSIHKTLGGVTTQIGPTSAEAFTTGVRTLGITVNGSNISLQLDGSTRLNVTDADIVGPGCAGVKFGTAGSPTTGIHITRFAIGPITTPIFDSFTAPDGELLTAHLPEIGQGYVAMPTFSPSAPPIILNGRARSQSSGSLFRNVTQIGRLNYQALAKWDLVGPLTDDIGLIVRASAIEPTFFFSRYRHGDGWSIWRVLNGAQSNLGTYPDDFSSGFRWQGLTCVEDRISLEINGATVLSFQNNEIMEGGYAGLRWGGQSPGSGRHLAQWRVINL